jgi:hypothetical protein
MFVISVALRGDGCMTSIHAVRFPGEKCEWVQGPALMRTRPDVGGDFHSPVVVSNVRFALRQKAMFDGE